MTKKTQSDDNLKLLTEPAECKVALVSSEVSKRNILMERNPWKHPFTVFTFLNEFILICEKVMLHLRGVLDRQAWRTV